MEIQHQVMLDLSSVALMKLLAAPIVIGIQPAQWIWMKLCLEPQDTLNAVVLMWLRLVAFQVLNLA